MKKLKAQMNIEFILGVSVLIVTISFIGFSIINHFPAIHADSVFETEKSKSFQISQMLVYDTGVWSSPAFSGCSRLGLTDGKPYVLNASKIMALNLCSQMDYLKLKDMLGIEGGAEIIINISRINFTGGDDIKISECRPALISLTTPKFWSKRYAMMDNGTLDIIRVETAIYGYI